MTALLSLFSGGMPYIIGAGTIVVAFFAAIMKGRMDGAKLERAKVAAEEARARDIKDQVDNDIGAMTPEQARKELGQWHA